VEHRPDRWKASAYYCVVCIPDELREIAGAPARPG
jgi:hypothetical protein